MWLKSPGRMPTNTHTRPAHPPMNKLTPLLQTGTDGSLHLIMIILYIHTHTHGVRALSSIELLGTTTITITSSSVDGPQAGKRK